MSNKKPSLVLDSKDNKVYSANVPPHIGADGTRAIVDYVYEFNKESYDKATESLVKSSKLYVAPPAEDKPYTYDGDWD